jgi:hypothetical protein
MTLEVDGNRTENPDANAIAAGFGSINKRTGFFRGAISLVKIAHDQTHWLAAAGNPAEGFTLSYQDGDPLRDYFTDRLVPAAEVLKIFQAYACGDEWGREKFIWDTCLSLDRKTQFRRLVVIAVVASAVIWFVTRLLD